MTEIIKRSEAENELNKQLLANFQMKVAYKNVWCNDGINKIY